MLYNGNNGLPYSTRTLSGVLTDQFGGYGTTTLSYPVNGIQNGSPDGLALVDADGNVVQFLSYEGSFTAVGGPADGLTSTDIGVTEGGSTSSAQSIQLTGAGSTYDEFTWRGPQLSTFGAANTDQTFGEGGGGGTDPEPEPDPCQVPVTHQIGAAHPAGSGWAPTCVLPA